MLQYGYANFEHKGYYIASQNEFFHDRKKEREQKLNNLVNYIGAAGENACAFIGITTDLDLPSENPRFYFQMSGQENYRSARYAHGYVQDLEQEGLYIYGEKFMELLRAHFLSAEELSALPASGSDHAFPDVQWPQMDKELEPADLEEDLLAEILDSLLTGTPVILKLNRKGEAAGYYARKILLRIYECLPYGCRQWNGFYINVGPRWFESGNNTDQLPKSVKLCIAYGEVSLPDDIFGYTVIDMNQPLKAGKKSDRDMKFLRFLMWDKEREVFFQRVREDCETGSSNSLVPKGIYRNAFEIHELLQREVSDETIFRWCGWLNRSQSVTGDKLKKRFLNCIREKMDCKQMAEYLRSPQMFAELPDAAELKSLQLRNSGKAGDVLRLFQAVCEISPDTREKEIRTLGETLAGCYEIKIAEEADEFKLSVREEKIPTRESIEYLKNTLERIGEFNQSRLSICSCASGRIKEYLQQKTELLEQEYENCRRKEQQKMTEKLLEIKSTQLTFRILVEIYDEYREEQIYPICSRVGREECFQTAFGIECVEILMELLKEVTLPEDINELSQYLEDREKIVKSAFWEEQLTSDQRERFDRFADAAKMCMQMESVHSLKECLLLLGHLVQRQKGSGFDPEIVLLENTRKKLGKKVSEYKYREEEIRENISLCCKLALDEKACITELCESLWQIHMAEQEKCLRLLEMSSEWCMLSESLGRQAMVSGEYGLSVELCPQEALKLISWSLEKNREEIPDIVLKCGRNNPGWMASECGDDMELLDCVTHSMPDQGSGIYKWFLQQPLQNEELGRKVITELKEQGNSKVDLQQEADATWSYEIWMIYQRPKTEERERMRKEIADELEVLKNSLKGLLISK